MMHHKLSTMDKAISKINQRRKLERMKIEKEIWLAIIVGSLAAAIFLGLLVCLWVADLRDNAWCHSLGGERKTLDGYGITPGNSQLTINFTTICVSKDGKILN